MSGNWGPPDEDGWERSGVEFGFYHSLVDDDPEHAAPALEALGRVAASWSRMEHHLDALIIQINKPDHDPQLVEPHPVSFGNKIRLLKKWFNQYPPLAPYTEDMRYLTSKLKALAKDNGEPDWPLTRNLLLHAIPGSYDAEKKIIVLHHMSFEGENIRSRHVNVSLELLGNFAHVVQMANQFLGTITRELFTPEGFAKLQTRE